MKNLYFNKFEFNQAQSCVVDNPYEAKRRYEFYLAKYPRDYSAYTYYVSLLIRIGELDEAENTIDLIERLVLADKKFSSHQAIVDKYIQNLNFCKIKLLFYQGKYQELYTTYIEHIQNVDMINDMELNELNNNQTLYGVGIKTLRFFCRKQLNILRSVNRASYSYLDRQIVSYSYSDLYDHLQKHLMGNERSGDSVFFPEFPLDDIICEIKKYIPNDKRLFTELIDDTYVFKYSGCGKNNNKIADYFTVVCLHDTSDIITMYPSCNAKYLPSIDLEYMNVNNNVKIKKKSQIDKFNQRFGLK